MASCAPLLETLATHTAAHPWLAHRKKDLERLLQTKEMPGRHLESWRYTNTRSILDRVWQTAPASSPSLCPDWLDSLSLAGLAHRLIFINGQLHEISVLPGDNLQSAFDSDELKPTLCALDAWQCADFLQREGCAETPLAPDFAALNLALLSSGVLLRVPRNVSLKYPVHLLFISTESSLPCISSPRILLRLAECASAVVMESYIGATSQSAAVGRDCSHVYFHNAMTDVHLADEAHLQHSRLTLESANASHIGRLNVHQAADSRLDSTCLQLSGGLARMDLHARLEGRGSETNLSGLYMATGREHSDYRLHIEHAASETHSTQRYHGILEDRARAAFNGKIEVHQGICNVRAEQTNKNLLLSANAEINTKPELEIYSDNVQCAHGATVGQIDPDMLFYLRTRGLSEEESRDILVSAFAADILDSLPHTGARERLCVFLADYLPKNLCAPQARK
ncbi:MAG: Fe-S cluster assembly protein SufD [Candidatus Eutrophobiaceae bacterium]